MSELTKHKSAAKNKRLTSFTDHLNKQYGKRGTVKRETYEQEFESFKLGVLIQPDPPTRKPYNV